MDKNLLEFLAGERDVIILDGVVFSKERKRNGTEYITVIIDNKPSFGFWNNPDNLKTNKPKHTGGKKSYVMLMIEEVEKMRSQEVTNIVELVGCITCLSRYIEWGTGKLVHFRSKKPIQFKDFGDIFQFGRSKLLKILKQLKDLNLLVNTQEGYFISQTIIKKGATRNG